MWYISEDEKKSLSVEVEDINLLEEHLRKSDFKLAFPEPKKSENDRNLRPAEKIRYILKIINKPKLKVFGIPQWWLNKYRKFLTYCASGKIGFYATEFKELKIKNVVFDSHTIEQNVELILRGLGPAKLSQISLGDLNKNYFQKILRKKYDIEIKDFNKKNVVFTVKFPNGTVENFRLDAQKFAVALVFRGGSGLVQNVEFIVGRSYKDKHTIFNLTFWKKHRLLIFLFILLLYFLIKYLAFL